MVAPGENDEPVMPKWKALAFYGLVALFLGGWHLWNKREQAAQEGAAEVRSLPGQRVDLGEFEIGSNSVIVGDPAYEDEANNPCDDGMACNNLLIRVNNAVRGRWRAWYTKVSLDGERSAELVATLNGSKIEGWRTLGVFGVDTGQAGIFDRAHFRDQTVVPADMKWKHGPNSDSNRWYWLCCEATLSSIAGTIPFGVVSSSGRGDGMYAALKAESPDGVVGLKLVFLPQDPAE